MRTVISTILTTLVALTLVVPTVGAELRPLVGLSLFGGAERGGGADRGSNDDAGAIGGSEVYGLYPFNRSWGLQGSLSNQGGNGGYRLGVSAGPVFDYESGKVGLFGDYVYRNTGNNNYFYLRGVWSHYFGNFDLVFSYSQPVHSIQRTPTSIVDRIEQPNG